ncbi:YtxH domain-containing protein [Mucilaginibacter antarcticus]|uniref:YtxH domain-containing protein n=1 Tax=Mucilaginibacter antarcticus TaxID=1855725 RepID=A0ABW5XPK6_9SPHI
MGILKYAILGAAVAFGIKQLTKKREDGSSVLDDLTEQSPELIDKVKGFANQAMDQLSGYGKQPTS